MNLRCFGMCMLIAGLASTANAAAITFTVANFGDTNQLSTSGGLVEAVHFGNPGGATVVANGISFVAGNANSANLSLSNTVAGSGGLGDFYQPTTHSVGFTSITGLTLSEANTLLDNRVYAQPNNSSLVTLSSLIIGHSYQFQLLQVADSFTGNNMYLGDQPQGPYYGPYDWSNNAVQLVNGTFTANTTTQQFNHYVGGSNYAMINAYQLRDLSVPEPSALTMLLFGGVMMMLFRGKRS